MRNRDLLLIPMAIVWLTGCEIGLQEPMVEVDKQVQTVDAVELTDEDVRHTLASIYEHLDEWMTESAGLSREQVAALRDRALSGSDPADILRYALAARHDSAAAMELLDHAAARTHMRVFEMVFFMNFVDDYVDREIFLHGMRAALAQGWTEFPLSIAMNFGGAEEIHEIDPHTLLEFGKLVGAVTHPTTADAAASLSHLYMNGSSRLGIEPDPVRAANLLERYAELGNEYQAGEAARRFNYGEGIDRDLNRAYNLYLHAGDKGNEFGYNNAAWMLATCQEVKGLRRGAALDLIERGIAEHGPSSTNMDTLAAVYASMGRFSDAVTAQERAMELFKEEGRRAEGLPAFEERLDLYRNRKTYSHPECG